MGTVFLGLLLWVSHPVTGEPAPAKADPKVPVDGAQVFREKCASCHETEAPASAPDWPEVAASPGPALFDAGTKFNDEWLVAWLQDPKPIRFAGYRPFRHVVSTSDGDKIDLVSLERHVALEGEEARHVALYLAGLKAPVSPYPPAEPNDAIRAAVHFSKILPCAGCHRSAPDEGGLSGPELYTAGERLDPEWSRSFTWDPQAWSRRVMPRVSLRSDQLLELNRFVLKPVPPPEQRKPALKKDLLVSRDGVEITPVGEPRGRAELIYRTLCIGCHGIEGNGQGINAPYLFQSPRDHTSYDEMSRLTDDRVADAIKLGGAAVGKSSLMPAWGSVLSDADVELLVAYLRDLSGT